MGIPMDTPLTGAGMARGVVAGVIGIMLTVGTTGMIRGATALRTDTRASAGTRASPGMSAAPVAASTAAVAVMGVAAAMAAE